MSKVVKTLLNKGLPHNAYCYIFFINFEIFKFSFNKDLQINRFQY